MNKMKWTQIALTASLLIMVSAVATQATVLRAFVSSTGNDANAASNCPQATPCKTFAAAFPVVTAGGELIALDTSGYGPLTINKSITIATVPGATAFVVVATGTAGFTIAAGASDLVILRNINFNGSNAANTTGVQHNSGKLEIYDCKFAQLTTGLHVTNAKADVVDSNFSGNGTAVKCSGTGTNLSSPAVALVRINGGNIVNTTQALLSENPGVNLNNIWLKLIGGNSSDLVTNFAAIGTVYSCTGTGSPCFTPGFYSGLQSLPN